MLYVSHAQLNMQQYSFLTKYPFHSEIQQIKMDYKYHFMVTFQIYVTYASHITEVKKHINILAVFMQLAPDLTSFEEVNLVII